MPQRTAPRSDGICDDCQASWIIGEPMPNNVPFVPQLTGQPLADIALMHQYLLTLSRYLAEGEPDQGWSTGGTVEMKAVTLGMTLAELTDVVATLIHVLQDKGILSPG